MTRQENNKKLSTVTRQEYKRKRLSEYREQEGYQGEKRIERLAKESLKKVPGRKEDRKISERKDK